MTEYHVEYRIEVEADSPEDAATLVAGILANGGAERGVYHVREHVAEVAEVAIDLDPKVCSVCGKRGEREIEYGEDEDLCYGCHMQEQGYMLCPNCNEWVEGPLVVWAMLTPPVAMCRSCEHNARRSGWEPGQ